MPGDQTQGAQTQSAQTQGAQTRGAQTQRVAIVGAGLIGRAWALLFADAGWQVRVFDSAGEVLAALPDHLAQDLALAQRHGLVSGDPLTRIERCEALAQALADVDFVQENGPEQEAAKRALFAELDQLAPKGAILASSTSGIVASRFTEALSGRGRCLVGHPVNPPHLVPVVEVCGSVWTEPAAVQRAMTIYREIGQVPVHVRQEIDGFVVNRLQGALLAEAFRLVRDGVITPEDLDHTIADGLGLRWSFLGPFATIELNAPGGIEDYCARYCELYRRLADDPPTRAVFDEAAQQAIVSAWPHAPDAQRLAALTDRRNDRLAALRSHKAEQVRDYGEFDPD